VNVASHAAAAGKSARRSNAIIAYSVAKAGLHRLTADMAVELTGTGVSVIEVWPNASLTEGVLAQADFFGDLTGWLEPIFSGRVVAALIAAGDWQAWTGQAVVLKDVAAAVGVPVPQPTSQAQLRRASPSSGTPLARSGTCRGGLEMAVEECHDPGTGIGCR
jgi:NAD(P)-dependent dehydrogenase (short-subunit alcohol dehydrogenase family)